MNDADWRCEDDRHRRRMDRAFGAFVALFVVLVVLTAFLLVGALCNMGRLS